MWYNKSSLFSHSNGAKFTRMSMAIALWCNSQWICSTALCSRCSAVHCVQTNPTQIFVYFSVSFRFSPHRYEFTFYAVVLSIGSRNAQCLHENAKQNETNGQHFNHVIKSLYHQYGRKHHFIITLRRRSHSLWLSFWFFCHTVDFCRQPSHPAHFYNPFGHQHVLLSNVLNGGSLGMQCIAFDAC